MYVKYNHDQIFNLMKYLERQSECKQYLYEVQCTKCGRFTGGNGTPWQFQMHEVMDNVNHYVCPQCKHKLRKVRILVEEDNNYMNY